MTDAKMVKARRWPAQADEPVGAAKRPSLELAPTGPIINMLWVGGRLPWYAEASIRSFLHHGHGVDLYLYDDVPNLPKGCRTIDGNSVLPHTEIFTYKEDGLFKGYVGAFSNWFRYALLYEKGGWYVDTDVLCLRPFVAHDDYAFTSDWATAPPNMNANVIYVKHRRDGMIDACLRVCAEKKSNVVHAEVGPLLVDKVVRQRGLEQFVRPPSTFNPIHFGDVNLLLQPTPVLHVHSLYRRLRGLRPIYLGSSSAALHLFASILVKSHGIADWSCIPRSSHLWWLMARNGAIADEEPARPPAGVPAR